MLKMWKIPASTQFLTHVNVIGFRDIIPEFEHKYLGRELVTKGSSAVKVEMDENIFRLMLNVKIGSRTFYFNTNDNSWYVLTDR